MATAKQAKEEKITKRTVIKLRDGLGSIIASPMTKEDRERLAAAATKHTKVPAKKQAPLSASQARRLIRDLEYFVESGEMTPEKYKTTRAAIVRRIA